MKSGTKLLLPTYIGAGVGFSSFLFLGAIPGLLYGGYMGLIMAGIIFGTPVEPSLIAKGMTFGGMALGLLASMFLFLVVGALVGTGVGALVRSAGKVVEGSRSHAPARDRTGQ